MRIVIAPDKFKGSLTARDVATAIAAGLRQAVPDVNLLLLPIADGGDGTVDAFVAAGYEPITATVCGPTGHPVSARFGSSATPRWSSWPKPQDSASCRAGPPLR